MWTPAVGCFWRKKMKKLFSIIVVAFVFTFTIFAKDGNEILGKYKSSDGTIIEITNLSFSINGSTLPLTMGQSSSDFMTGMGGLTYYIKPCFIYNDKKITLTNIWLQYPGNDILAVYIFTYDVETKKLTVTSWDVFSVSMVGATTEDYTKI
jgi:hypothetical protein